MNKKLEFIEFKALINEQQQDIGHRVSQFLIELVEHKKYLQSEITKSNPIAIVKSDSLPISVNFQSHGLPNKSSSVLALVYYEELASFLKLIFEIFDDFYGPIRKGLKNCDTDMGFLDENQRLSYWQAERIFKPKKKKKQWEESLLASFAIAFVTPILIFFMLFLHKIWK